MIAVIAVYGAALMCATLLGIGLAFSPFGFVLTGSLIGAVCGFVVGYARREGEG